MDPDYYTILGVSPTADLETIHLAFRQKAAQCHPDHGGSHERMVEVNTAWEVLSDPELRIPRRFPAVISRPRYYRCREFRRECTRQGISIRSRCIRPLAARDVGDSPAEPAVPARTPAPAGWVATARCARRRRIDSQVAFVSDGLVGV